MEGERPREPQGLKALVDNVKLNDYSVKTIVSTVAKASLG